MEPLGKVFRATKGGQGGRESTKNKQLSRVLYDAVVEIVNSGELSEDILGKQVFIKHVRIYSFDKTLSFDLGCCAVSFLNQVSFFLSNL